MVTPVVFRSAQGETKDQGQRTDCPSTGSTHVSGQSAVHIPKEFAITTATQAPQHSAFPVIPAHGWYVQEDNVGPAAPSNVTVHRQLVAPSGHRYAIIPDDGFGSVKARLVYSIEGRAGEIQHFNIDEEAFEPGLRNTMLSTMFACHPTVSEWTVMNGAASDDRELRRSVALGPQCCGTPFRGSNHPSWCGLSGPPEHLKGSYGRHNHRGSNPPGNTALGHLGGRYRR